MKISKVVHAAGLAIVCVGAAFSTMASAGALPDQPALVLSPPQSLVAVHIGNGVDDNKDAVGVNSDGSALVVVHALSGVNGQYGSAASVAALNTNRLLGVDGSGGLNSPTALTVDRANPGKPIFAH